MLKKTNASYLREHLEQVGLKPGMDITVHSRLTAFGIIDGHPPRAALDAIRDVVGPKATIVMPTYTFGLDPSIPYDPLTTPSPNVGALAEYLRTFEGAVRSLSPIHSHSGIGPKASLLRKTPMDVSVGPKSDFEMLSREGFQLLLLGCKFSEGCTHLHHVEALCAVPYREWIDLDRIVKIGDGPEQKVKLRYYGRKHRHWKASFDAVVQPLRERYNMQEAAAPYGQSFLVSLTDLEDCASGLLSANPYALVRRVSVEQPT